MRSKTGMVRSSVRPYDQRSGAQRGQAPDAGPVDGAPADEAGGEKSEVARRAILDATLACFAEHGWSGTNMSVIARRSRMTRGRIQYYFPTLDDLLRAAIEHLMVEWRRTYFELVSEAADAPSRFESGIDVLWRLIQDPLHVAKQELEASARTNPELRALVERAAIDDEEASVEAAKLTYPELAVHGDAALRVARNFTMVFMEGLALYRFSGDAEPRRAELIDMLKSLLITYWSSLGVEDLEAPPRPHRAPVVAHAPLRNEKYERALALIREAESLLSS